MNVLRKLFGGSASPPKEEEKDEFGVRKMSSRELAQHLAMGKNILKHGEFTSEIVELHDDPERRKHWRERIAKTHAQVGKKVSAIEAEIDRRSKHA